MHCCFYFFMGKVCISCSFFQSNTNIKTTVLHKSKTKKLRLMKKTLAAGRIHQPLKLLTKINSTPQTQTVDSSVTSKQSP